MVVLAQEEARLLNHAYIGTEHLLLGLVSEGEGAAARALAALNITREAARNEVKLIVGGGSEAPPQGYIPFTPSAKKALELSLRNALGLGHSFIGTEHILLGLVQESEGVAGKVLDSLGISPEAVRSEVKRITRRGRAAPTGHMPFTGPAKKVLELSLRESLQLGHSYIGTEHILLGRTRQQESVAAQEIGRAHV